MSVTARSGGTRRVDDCGKEVNPFYDIRSWMELSSLRDHALIKGLCGRMNPVEIGAAAVGTFATGALAE